MHRAEERRTWREDEGEIAVRRWSGSSAPVSKTPRAPAPYVAEACVHVTRARDLRCAAARKAEIARDPRRSPSCAPTTRSMSQAIGNVRRPHRCSAPSAC